MREHDVPVDVDDANCDRHFDVGRFFLDAGRNRLRER
jgi:hypothetical protein